MDTKKIPIFLASDENYAPFVATTIRSFLKHTESFLHFFVLDDNILAESKQLIEESIAPDFSNYEITYIDANQFDLSRFPDVSGITVTTYARYFIPETCPFQYEKAIYSDVDVIVQLDVAELYRVELEGHAIAAVPADYMDVEYIHSRHLQELDSTHSGIGFSAGLLVLDIRQFRAKQIQQALIDLTIKHFGNKNLRYGDQDILNLYFKNDYRRLDCKYIYPANPLYVPTLKEFCEAKGLSMPKPENSILHYLTGTKPWNDVNCIYLDEFWETLVCTKFMNRVVKMFGISNRQKERDALIAATPVYYDVTLFGKTILAINKEGDVFVLRLFGRFKLASLQGRKR